MLLATGVFWEQPTNRQSIETAKMALSNFFIIRIPFYNTVWGSSLLSPYFNARPPNLSRAFLPVPLFPS